MKKRKHLHLTSRKKSDQNSTIYKYAAIADASRMLTRFDKMNKLHDYFGHHCFRLLTPYTNEYMAVWVSDIDNEVVTSFVGFGRADHIYLESDFLIASDTEKFADRFTTIQKQYKDVLRQYETYTHVLTSCSFGAVLNNRMVDVFGKQIAHVYNYNPGSPVYATFLPLHNSPSEADRSHIHSFYIGTDSLSALRRGNQSHDVVVLAPLAGSLNYHSMQQFLN